MLQTDGRPPQNKGIVPWEQECMMIAAKHEYEWVRSRGIEMLVIWLPIHLSGHGIGNESNIDPKRAA